MMGNNCRRREDFIWIVSRLGFINRFGKRAGKMIIDCLYLFLDFFCWTADKRIKKQEGKENNKRW